MPRIPPLPPDSAPPEVRAVYEDFHKRMCFPSAPNFITTQGHAPCAARGSWDLVRSVLVGGKLPRWLKEMMFVAISKDRDCRYCEAAHLACCRMLGVNPGLLASLVHDIRGIPDPKLRDMMGFAVKCARVPQELTDADFVKLRQHGLLEAEIMEMIAMSALAVYANIIADATGVEADAMFDEV